MFILSRVLMGMVLFIQSIWDLREKEIPTVVSLFGALGGFIISLWNGRGYKEMLLACIPGIILFLCARVTKEAVGYGDALLLTAMGMTYSTGEIGFICVIAFALASEVALILFAIFHKKGNYPIPFVPFLGIGWLVEFMSAYGGIR